MAHISNYLAPEVISKIENLHLRARLMVEGFIVGLHKSPYHGFSVEFSEHRAYGHGDEIKRIDWKLFGKTNRYYIKQFEEETNLRAYLLLDQSKSMEFSSGSITKLQYGKTISAVLSYLMLRQQDAVGMAAFDTKIRNFIPARSKSRHLSVLLSAFDQLQSGEETSIAPILHQIAEKINKRGLIVLVSDLFDEPEKVLSGLKHFRHRGHEVVVFHVLDRREYDLDFKQRTRFIDMESGKKLTTDPWHIREYYTREIKEFCNFFRRHCRKNRMDYIRVFTDEPLDKVLSNYLMKRSRMS